MARLEKIEIVPNRIPHMLDAKVVNAISWAVVDIGVFCLALVFFVATSMYWPAVQRIYRTLIFAEIVRRPI